MTYLKPEMLSSSLKNVIICELILKGKLSLKILLIPILYLYFGCDFVAWQVSVRRKLVLCKFKDVHASQCFLIICIALMVTGSQYYHRFRIMEQSLLAPKNVFVNHQTSVLQFLLFIFHILDDCQKSCSQRMKYSIAVLSKICKHT